MTTTLAEGRTDYRDALVYGLLAVAVLAVFGQSLRFEFVNYDDPHYVINNHALHQGLTVEGIRWALTTGYAENWHPLTWISHMVDFNLHGMNPGGHRFTNILLHLLASFALFAVLKSMTSSRWPSAAVAMLFAIHPLHVESVVWIAERKDVLSGLFWMLTLGAYLRWVREPSAVSYVALVGVFALGLMAKSMLVTLPCVLLLLDYWPLKRVRTMGDWRGLVLEKAPLFALSALFSVVTFLVQQAGETTKALSTIPLDARLSNALVSYVVYLRKMIWPMDLAVLYPHPGGSIPLWQTLGAAVLLVVVTGVAWWFRKGAPYGLVGWLWYSGTLVPVIGIVQVGDQALADRYTYIPLVGIFVALAWAGRDVLAWKGGGYSPAAVAGGVLVLALGALSLGALAWVQVGYWRTSVTLFERCVAVTENNSSAHNNLGRAYHSAGELDEAERHYREALRISPWVGMARHNLGLLALERGEHAEAEALFYALSLETPGEPRTLLNLGVARVSQGDYSGAREAFEEALAIAPDYPPIHRNLALLHAKMGDLAAAEHHWERVLAIQPLDDDARLHLEALREASPAAP